MGREKFVVLGWCTLREVPSALSSQRLSLPCLKSTALPVKSRRGEWRVPRMEEEPQGRILWGLGLSKVIEEKAPAPCEGEWAQGSGRGGSCALLQPCLQPDLASSAVCGAQGSPATSLCTSPLPSCPRPSPLSLISIHSCLLSPIPFPGLFFSLLPSTPLGVLHFVVGIAAGRCTEPLSLIHSHF